MTSIFKKSTATKDAPTAGVVSNGHSVAQPIEVTDADFADLVLKAGVPAVVDLWAEWCGPCHMIAPSVQQLAQAYEGRAVIAKLNVDENPHTPGRYGIMGIPTLLYFKDGKEVDRQVGVTNFANLANKLEKLLN